MRRVVPRRASVSVFAGLCCISLVAAAAVAWVKLDEPPRVGSPSHTTQVVDDRAGNHLPGSAGPRGRVTLAFAGDMHFQLQLAALLDQPRGALGPITETLEDADLTMANLESAITDRGTPEAKELEASGQRYWFRTLPAALDVLAAAGIDVVTVANNHGADYGPVGLRDTLAAGRTGPIAVVGIGRDRESAFTPYRVTVRGTSFAYPCTTDFKIMQ